MSPYAFHHRHQCAAAEVQPLLGLKRGRDAFPIAPSPSFPLDKENDSGVNKGSLAFILTSEHRKAAAVPRLPSLASMSLANPTPTLPTAWGTPQKLAVRPEPALHPQTKLARHRVVARVGGGGVASASTSAPVKKGSKYCMVEGCMSRAKHARRCWRHGGSVKCKVPDCSNRAKTKGVCWSHGGGTTCSFAGCATISVSNGVCWAHGGGKRCVMSGCARPAYERTDHLCTLHFEEKQYIARLQVAAAPVAPLPTGFAFPGAAGLHNRL